MDLELILQKISGCKKIFKKNGEYTVKGLEAYMKLMDIIYNLEDVTGVNLSRLISEIDEIDNIKK